MSIEPQLRSVRASSPATDRGRATSSAAARVDEADPPGPAASDPPEPAASAGRLGPDAVARRALDVGRRTALGVLAGDHATADDVAQEVAIQALRHADRLRDPAALDAWLHRTAARAALRSVRRVRRRRAVEADHVAAVGTAPASTPTSFDDLGVLLRGLPHRQRAALTLRYAHDLDDARIAAALGCREVTVRALLSRGRAAVRARLDGGASDAAPVRRASEGSTATRAEGEGAAPPDAPSTDARTTTGADDA